MVTTLTRYAEEKQRHVSRARFRLVDVLALRARNYVPSDDDWHELENALRAIDYILVRVDGTSIAILSVDRYDSWIQLGFGQNQVTS